MRSLSIAARRLGPDNGNSQLNESNWHQDVDDTAGSSTKAEAKSRDWSSATGPLAISKPDHRSNGRVSGKAKARSPAEEQWLARVVAESETWAVEDDGGVA